MDDAHSVVTHIVGILRRLPDCPRHADPEIGRAGKHPVQETDREWCDVVVVHVDQDLRWHGASGDARHQRSLDAPGVQNRQPRCFASCATRFATNGFIR